MIPSINLWEKQHYWFQHWRKQGNQEKKTAIDDSYQHQHVVWQLGKILIHLEFAEKIEGKVSTYEKETGYILSADKCPDGNMKKGAVQQQYF